MGNLGNPQSITSCIFRKVFSENMGHTEPIEIIIIQNCPKLRRIYGIYVKSWKLPYSSD